MPLKLFVTYGVGFVGVAFNFTSNLYILSLDIMSRYSRIYIGRLPYQAREKDVERFFRGFGRIRDINLKNGFGFVVSFKSQKFHLPRPDIYHPKPHPLVDQGTLLVVLGLILLLVANIKLDLSFSN